MKVFWTHKADKDIERIWHFLADRNVDLADRIEETIRSSIDLLRDLPHKGRLRPDGSRELVLTRVQYIVGYYICEERIVVWHIRSTRENV